MYSREIIAGITYKFNGFNALSISERYPDELCIKVSPEAFKDTCLALHKILSSPVMMFFALDERKDSGNFVINAVFLDIKKNMWAIVSMDIPQENPSFETLAKNIHSASMFEREIWEMFGIEPKGSPDLRSLSLHDEVCPKGNHPLRKDFKKIQAGDLKDYKFNRVNGDGIFEVPVGPVHAGIIGPGHFRFSVAGEPIINLETRLGFTHRGVEKLFEGKHYNDAICLSERVSGDASFSHSLAFAHAIEKIIGARIPDNAIYLRGVFLELERMYNHVNDISGIALDVGFSFPAAYGAIIKEAILQLNNSLALNRYLKDVNAIGGILRNIDKSKKQLLINSIKAIKQDFNKLIKILYSSVSFMDRVDTTGILYRKTAEDLGVVGIVGRASGISMDLRKHFSKIYKEAKFRISVQGSGDVLARLKIRVSEFEESCRLIEEFTLKLIESDNIRSYALPRPGSALGYVEGWRGPVLYWVKIDPEGIIERCKITDPSSHNWQALSYAVLGNIIPDFPLCNKSFDLSYAGNDL